MDYSKLEKLRESEKNQKLFAKKIGRTEQGVAKMFANRTLTVAMLEHICLVYKVPITSFFEDEPHELQEPPGVYERKICEKLEAKVDLLTDLLRDKDEEIARLNRELGRKEPQKKNGAA